VCVCETEMHTWSQIAANPRIKPIDLGCKSICMLLPSVLTIAIY